MPSYSSTGPITASIQLAAGDARIEASDRDQTVVDVMPMNPQHQPDVAAAEQTSVTYENDSLHIIGAKGRGVGLLRKPGAVRVVVTVPTGSHVTASTGLGLVQGSGRLGRCRIRTGAGDVVLGDAASLNIVTGLGAVSAENVSGDASCATGSGSVRIARVGGSTQIKNSNGDTWLGDVGAGATVKSSNGSVTVDRAHADLKVATAAGSIRVGSVERGSVDLKTALGRVEVGIATGTAARLDLSTSYGGVQNTLEETSGPAAGDVTVGVTAHTSAGDIVIARAQQDK